MRLFQVIVAIDQLLNTILGGFADETLSARAYRNDSATGKKRWRIARRFIDKLFFWEQSHCRHAYLAEIDRRQYPPAYRGNKK